MIDVLKKVFKPIATASAVIIGIGVATLISDPKNWKDIYDAVVGQPVGPARYPDYFNKDEVTVLHADELRQLRWMSVAQLKAMFKGKHDRFCVDISPAAFQELRWMSTAQIEAIFGTDAPKTSL